MQSTVPCFPVPGLRHNMELLTGLALLFLRGFCTPADNECDDLPQAALLVNMTGSLNNPSLFQLCNFAQITDRLRPAFSVLRSCR